MPQDPSILKFPSTTESRLEAAIRAFDSGDKSKELLDEFIDLINKGFKEANYYIGCMYEDGTNGVQKNPEHAFFYYKQSVEGFGYLEGYLALARLYYHGTGVPQNYHRAFEYYNHVAQKKEHPVACFMLGRMYQYGTGTDRDLQLARNCYMRAIVQGSVYGMINLAMLEAEEGNMLKSIGLRIKAGLYAFWIARKNPHDARLRGG